MDGSGGRELLGSMCRWRLAGLVARAELFSHKVIRW